MGFPRVITNHQPTPVTPTNREELSIYCQPFTEMDAKLFTLILGLVFVFLTNAKPIEELPEPKAQSGPIIRECGKILQNYVKTKCVEKAAEGCLWAYENCGYKPGLAHDNTEFTTPSTPSSTPSTSWCSGWLC